MKLGEKSHKKIEEFFREYLADDNFRLPDIEFYGGKFTNFLTKQLKIEGITIGRRVYICPVNLRLSKNGKLRLDEELAVHEIAHVLQYRREGFFRFLWMYQKSYYANLKKSGKRDLYAKAEAYLEIPFEIEARQTASKFADWSKNRRNK